MPTLQEIMLRAQALRQETAVDSISPERAGSIMYDTLAYINQMQLQGANPLLISKIYASVEAMEADSAPVSELTGEPLRPGQVVVIATGDPDDPDEGVVYRYDGTEDGASSWTAVGKIGNVEPVDSLDSDSTQLPLAAHQGKVLDGKITELGQNAVGLEIASDAVRQGTPSNIFNTDWVCFKSISPRHSAKKAFAFTTVPAPENCIWKYRFDTFNVEAGQTHIESVARSLFPDGNEFEFQSGEKGYCVSVACYNTSTEQFVALSPSAFDKESLYCVLDNGQLNLLREEIKAVSAGASADSSYLLKKVIELRNATGLNATMRQGSQANPSNTTNLCSLKLLPVNYPEIPTVKVSTNKPAPENCEWRWGFQTFSLKEGDSYGPAANASRLRSIPISANNDTITFTNGENSFCILLACYNLVTASFENIDISDFAGYYVSVTSQPIFALYGDLEIEANARKDDEKMLGVKVYRLLDGSFFNPGNITTIKTNWIAPVASNQKISVVLSELPPLENYKWRYQFFLFKTSGVSTFPWPGNQYIYEQIPWQDENYIITPDDSDKIEADKIHGISVQVSAYNPITGDTATLSTAQFNNLRVAFCYNGIVQQITTNTSLPYTRNIQRDGALHGACRFNFSGISPYKDFQLCMISDIHSDEQALRNCVDMVNSFNTIDAVINCGDTPGQYFAEDNGWYNRQTARCTKPIFNVLGNHDVGYSPLVRFAGSHRQVYDKWIKPMVDAGVLAVGEYEDGKSYYFHDFANYKIRLIVLYEADDYNEFYEEYWKAITYNSTYPEIVDGDSYSVGDKVNVPNFTEYSFECVSPVTPTQSNENPTEPAYSHYRGWVVIRQEQAEWFLDTLADTPDGYSVIVAGHQMLNIPNWEFVFDNMFCQANVGGFDMNLLTNGQKMAVDFVSNAVAAWKNKENFEEYVSFRAPLDVKNVNEGPGGIMYAYHVSKDFSSASSRNFMCFLAGHLHCDYIFRQNINNHYLVVPITANTVFRDFSTYADIKRSEKDGYAKDSLTVISFDTDNNKLRLVKLGVNVNWDGEKRDFGTLDLTEAPN